MSALSMGLGMIGDSEPMSALRALIATAARTRLPVLVQGPTGAGKELVAAALHTASGRRGRLVAFNVCAIGDSMFEDALFGHVRGAFTGAQTDVPGHLLEADGGTAFFDEIGALPLPFQAKLLRAIETGDFRQIGGRRDVHSDFRVVAATNEAVGGLVQQGRFRSDLAHRIGGIVICVPSLVERLDDIPMLVRHFLNEAGAAHLRVCADAMRFLQKHDWPGNVRELKQVTEWAAALCESDLSADAVRSALTQRATHSTGSPVSETAPRERNRLRALLERHCWEIELAAGELGVSRATLYRRLKAAQVAVAHERSTFARVSSLASSHSVSRESATG